MSLLPLSTDGDAEVRFRSTVRDLLIFTSRKDGAQCTENRVADAFATRHAQFVNTPAETVFFWSPDQYDVLQRQFVILKGGTYGGISQLIILAEYFRLIFFLSQDSVLERPSCWFTRRPSCSRPGSASCSSSAAPTRPSTPPCSRRS